MLRSPHIMADRGMPSNGRRFQEMTLTCFSKVFVLKKRGITSATFTKYSRSTSVYMARQRHKHKLEELKKDDSLLIGAGCRPFVFTKYQLIQMRNDALIHRIHIHIQHRHDFIPAAQPCHDLKT